MKLYTLREAAELFRISRRTLHYLIERKEIRRIKISGRRFVTEDELAKFVNVAVEAAT